MSTEFALERPAVILNGFDIYESKTRLCIVGSNESEGYYRVLRISRTAGLKMVEDDASHTRESVQKVVSGIQSSGMKLVVSNVCGILGFVRFTKGYYISLVTKRKPVALLGGHYVYHVEDTRLLSIAYRPERSDEEEKCITRFKNVDLTKNFYYSHTYDITHTLQRNVDIWNKCSRSPQGLGEWTYHSMFVWNYQLICNATRGVGLGAEWTVALIHGYVDQSRLSIFGRDVFITLIARRSRIFAGVRYLKRGVNDAGYVANDVETEQIVNTMEVTSFDMPYGRPFSNPYYTAYVQHRGSIPLFWSQETSGITPKPPIEINVRDPYFVEAGRHFDSLFDRYGTPIIVLNLIKTKERTKRESALGEEFSEGLHYLNQFLPRGKKIRYLAWDMSRAKKNRQEDVLAILEVIAEETLTLTGYFHNGKELYSNYLKRRTAGDAREQRQRARRQTGIVRSNCIDCLDRTNAAQSIIGKVALAHQLFELGQIDEPYLSFNTDAAMIIEEMYHDLGNTIALQYGGSHLVNTVQTYRRSTNWRSHSRDIVESLRRYYSNSLLDMERQEAITFFVEKSMFPECNPQQAAERHLDGVGKVVSRPNQVGKPVFRKWWTTLGDSSDTDGEEAQHSLSPDGAALAQDRDGYWNEYYRPHQYTSFDGLFLGNLNSSASLHANGGISSPFADRSGSHKGRHKSYASLNMRYMQREPKWLKSNEDEYADPTLVSRQEIYNRVSAKTAAPQQLEPMGIGGWITDGITTPLQEPQVGQTEMDEYAKYVHQFDDLQKWIVPPSSLLYSDHIRQSQGEPAACLERASAASSGLQINTRQDSDRPHTPVLSDAGYPIRMPMSAQPLGARRDRWLPASHLSPTTERLQRLRSNTTASGERGSLWRLWGSQTQEPTMDSRMPQSARAAQSDFRHDRSRSLDFSNVQPPITLPSDQMAAEPRVAEADLAIYQSYVKMRKAMSHA
ncbi:phosphatidylinositol-3,5-bisphosphate 5-phosphatase [Coemansia sp. RSA 989]|nr:phosphatidylinositol-3,5-bisphosphate 5-phosphatase [Coemansia sp. RSA 1086]KAJ1748943.1 phosphatidylinositol-3,5-bisphosphate 5-phosphatase [Coemansia sp. RSA 1821]KAJ1863120.1 phosphatidylinositol-3,5-bisphosphate 5-phosphatase [Coemansia sp. RSA 989]KAJ1871861.1 phosphatidylinositol-3,5-bisphosphate 5-phosphatase [Coemansia sp. RSA 990]KAJ2651266.1 phosphatidylinositol-3,5-bisphosphate 5-phosphatase [Coemansia sp. RSA 1250]KAJ2673755.1 phosphatidylinositol-3,5-bisphosphate 5-phosphatase 